tara:strand:- start:198 stop:836 length:639 start_codon:yes stop_codon:yes gene_type:complete
MVIYTGNAYGTDLEEVKARSMGIMACTGPGFKPSKQWRGLPCALDNGAFMAWKRGFPFPAEAFRASIRGAYSAGLELDFIVCPDIVAGGCDSLDFSIGWAKGELLGCSRLALAVQDGMKLCDLSPRRHLPLFSHIFIGGTLGWKWRTAGEWIRFAHDRGLKAHIGRCGTLAALQRAHELGADSIDSTSFVRNKSWAIVDAFRGGCQITLEEA